MGFPAFFMAVGEQVHTVHVCSLIFGNLCLIFFA